MKTKLVLIFSAMLLKAGLCQAQMIQRNYNGTGIIYANTPGVTEIGTAPTAAVTCSGPWTFTNGLTVSGTTTLATTTLSSPLISGGLTASGSATNDFSGSTGAFKASSGATTLPNLTSNGIVTTSGGTGLLSVTATTGSGSVVLATSPTLTTPTIGAATATTINGNTFTAGTYTLTGTAGKTLNFQNTLTLAGTDSTTMTFPSTSATIARTDAANTFTGHQTIEGVTSTGATGTGNLVFATSPTLTTPTLGVATATTINGNTFTTGTYTLTGTAAKTLTFNNSLTLAGTDSTTMTFPSTSATIARTDAGNTFTGAQTISGQLTLSSGLLFTAPNTQTGATYTVAATDVFIIANVAGTQTETLGTATAGRVLVFDTITANTVVSASSNVIPVVGGAAGTAILAATAGKWALLVGNGTNWQIMMAN